MALNYDLVVVGGGPAGLQAAKTAAENGLKVALVERKSDPSKIQRSCAQMFLMNMDSFYNESMYFSREKKKWIFPVNNFSVNYPGDYREFYACHFVAPNAEDRIEIGDYEANASGKGVPAVVFDKGALLNGIFEEGLAAGVDYYLERNVTYAGMQNGAVRVVTAEGDRLSGTFCIAADGINSRLARVSGLNKERIFLNTRISYSPYVTGVEFERSEAIFLGLSWDKGGLGAVPFCLLPSVYRDDEYWLFVNGEQQFDFLTRRSSFKKWFPRLAVTHMRACVVNNWSPAREPFKDNIVFAGDSCWFSEAENSGALLSGQRAANAVCEALHKGQPGREGVRGYLDWWRMNWTETHDYRDFLGYPIFNRLFTEEEHNYLHHVISEKLAWTLNPFKLYVRIMQGIKPRMDRITRERPLIARKIARFKPELALQAMKPVARRGFPNR
ncbi:MAG: FAD-dependent oxidoreductase [Deltaproteobacteria bacterium]|nr:FAD-dependent oxidoreductase [Deltaproteobacteria bacterium]